MSKYADHVPLHRQEGIWRRHGVELSRKTMCGWMRQTAELLDPLYERMKEQVLASKVVQTDDTPVPVRDPALPKTRTGRIWTYVGDADHPVTVYDYTATRKRDGPDQFLGEYQGYLRADAYTGYDAIYTTMERGVVEVACMAHPRRKWYEARSSDLARAMTALAYIGLLYKVERRASGLRGDERRAVREWYSEPVLEEFHGWMERQRGQVLPKSPEGVALNYALSNWAALCRYKEDGDLEIDNNGAERSLRGMAVGRRNVQRAGRLQPVSGALRSARVHDGGRDRDHPASSQGEVSGRQAADHLRQRAAIHRPRLQGIHPPGGHDPRPNGAQLSPVERKNRALAPVAQNRVPSAGYAADAGRCAAADSAVRGPLQHDPVAQRHRVRDAGRHAGGAPSRNPRGPRSQAGTGAATASIAPSAGGMRFRVTMALPGETAAGSAGTQPSRGIAWWAHRDDDPGRGSRLSRPPQNHIGSVDPHALKIPARRAEYSLTGNADSPVPAEPEHVLESPCRRAGSRAFGAQLLSLDRFKNSNGRTQERFFTRRLKQMARCWTCGSYVRGWEYTCGVCRNDESLKKLRKTVSQGVAGKLYDIEQILRHNHEELCSTLSEGLSGIASAIEWGFGELRWQLQQQSEILKSIDRTLRSPAETQANEYRLMAEELRNRGVLDEAEQFYQKALRLNPLDYRLYVGLAETHLRSGFFDRAKLFLEKSLPHAPRADMDYRSYSLRLIAHIHTCNEEYDRGAQLLKTAIDFSPSYAEAYYDHAQCCAQLGQVASSISSLRAAIRLKPHYWYLSHTERNFDGIRSEIRSALTQMHNSAARAADEKIEKAESELRRAAEEIAWAGKSLVRSKEYGPLCSVKAGNVSWGKLQSAKERRSTNDFFSLLVAVELASESCDLARQATAKAAEERSFYEGRLIVKLGEYRANAPIESVRWAFFFGILGFLLFGFGGCCFRLFSDRPRWIKDVMWPWRAWVESSFIGALIGVAAGIWFGISEARRDAKL